MQKFKKYYVLNDVTFEITVSEFVTVSKKLGINVNCLIPSMRQFDQYSTENLNEVPKLVQKCEQICRNIILNKVEHLDHIMSNLGFNVTNS